MADVFLSYAAADAGFVVRIARALERAGLSAARAPQTATADWPVRLYGEIDQASTVLAVFSRRSMACEWTLMEAAIGQHYGQLVAVRIDKGLDIATIPMPEPDRQTCLIDLIEDDVAPSGWNQEADVELDRRLAGLAARIRQLKARGPFSTPSGAAGAPPDSETVAKTLRAGFSWPRHDGSERKSLRSLPALAATRRESAFRTAFTTLAAMDYPYDIRTGLGELNEPSTARRGIARLYAEALQRNDSEFWSFVGRIASPISSTLSLACLLRASAGSDEIDDLIDPRDAREMHAERIGKRVSGRSSAFIWPIAAVAAGLAAVLLAPVVGDQISKFSLSNEVQTVSADQGPTVIEAPPVAEVAAPKQAKAPELVDPKSFAPPPWAPDRQLAPNVTVAPNPVSPPPVANPTPPPTPVAPPPIASAPPPALAPSAPPVQDAKAIIRLCRGLPGPTEMTIEVMPDERFGDVAGRVFMADPANLRRFLARNQSCLGARKLILSDGRELGGADLIFPGDRLIVPQATNTVIVTDAPAVKNN